MDSDMFAFEGFIRPLREVYTVAERLNPGGECKKADIFKC